MKKQNFCALHWFQERDIDMWLAEELRVNPVFSGWFLDRCAPELELKHPAVATRVSVHENGSETDVLASFQRRDGGLHRVWIENKISAGLMPRQLERYMERGSAEVDRGVAASFSVVVFAPTSHPVTLPPGVARLNFEEAAEVLLLGAADARLIYRAEILARAAGYASPASQARAMAEHEPHVVAWWDDVYSMLEHEFPGYFMPPRTRYMRDMFFAPRTHDLAKYLRVDCKLRLGEVDLAFKNMPFSSLRGILDDIKTMPGMLVENGKSTAIRITGLPQVSFTTRPDGPDVRRCFSAVQELIEFWRANRNTFDRAVAEQQR